MLIRPKFRCSLIVPVLIWGAICQLPTPVQGQEVRDLTHTQITGGPLHAYEGTVRLPADGLWLPLESEAVDSIRELYLIPTEPTRIRQLGKRMYAVLEDQLVRNNRWTVLRGYEASRTIAQRSGGIGPSSINDLAANDQWEYVAKTWNTSPYRINDLRQIVGDEAIKGPFVHLIPKVHFQFTEPKNAKPRPNGTIRMIVTKADRQPLAFSIRPIIDDGKHWVLYTDGNCDRVEIDREWVASLGAQIKPLIRLKEIQQAREQPTVNYDVVLVTSQPLQSKVVLSASNQILGKETTIALDVNSAETRDYNRVSSKISEARKSAWRMYGGDRGGVLNTWNQSGAANANARRPQNVSMFSVLGGRAAIEETLQLQNLAISDSEDQATIDIATVDGVTVKSHPFKEMLGGNEGGQIALARNVPHDRFFVYIGKPEKIPAILDKGAPYIATLGTAVSGNCLNYNLESKYLGRLGMNREWVDAVLKSGLASEMAVFTPDLFFIDGTDITVVAKLRHPKMLAKLIGMLSKASLDDSSILELPTATNRTAFMALRGQLLFASTNRAELEASLELHVNAGTGSLGDSDEFRYMLTQLPVSDNTRAFAYMSDPFVRRLVGPKVKIAQRRRVIAKARMEAVTGRALLAKLDGQAMDDDLMKSVRANYLPGNWQDSLTTVSAKGLARSERYGTLPEMKSLPEVPVEKITPEEAEAYNQYRERYSRYWRRFFDPIAVRLDEVGEDQLELSTFILPLVDNSIYNQFRQLLAHQDDATPLLIPVVEPKPVVQFSANLKEEAWQQIAGNFSEFFRQYSGASSAMLDDFGPSVHVALHDADPIIAVGSGDIFGAFGGNRIGFGNDMMIPVVVSMLTRPCSIMVETKSPERTSQYLRQAALANQSGRSRTNFATSFYQVGDRDQWVWTMDVFGVVKLRYGIEVVDNYMVIRNIPWSSNDRVVRTIPAELNAAVLRANPSVCREQLPSLFAAASDGNRKAVMNGMGRLYPFMLCGADSVEAAARDHQRLFGFYPKQIGGDRWHWKDYRMVSEQYGEPMRQRQPAFDPDEPFGMMSMIDFVELNMQFEQDGLRSNVRWRLK